MNELATKAHTWIELDATDCTIRSQPTGIYHLRKKENLKAQLEVLTNELEAIKTKESRTAHMVTRVETKDTCFIYEVIEYLIQNFPTSSEMRGVYEEKCNVKWMFRKPYLS